MLFALVPAIVSAEGEHPVDQQCEACIDRDSSTAGILKCLDEAYVMWDRELNTVYRNLRKLLGPQQLEALKTSQRAWLRYRDAEFETLELMYRSLDGTMWAIAAQDDKVELVKTRVLTLSIYLDSLQKGL